MTIRARRAARRAAALAAAIAVLEDAGRSETADRRSVAKARWLVRNAITQDDDAAARRALAEHYRRLGVRSQAGRWGILIPGWTTDEELRELRLWLLGQAWEHDFVRDLLALPSDAPLPPAVADLVDPAFRAPRPRPGSAFADIGCLLWLLMLLGFAVAGVCSISLLWKAATDASDLFESAQALYAVGAPAGAIALVSLALAIWQGRRERRRERTDPTPQPDDRHAVRLASKLSEAGDDRAADVLLRACVRWADDDAARRFLVERARTAGRSDQAGRWAVRWEGESTASERDAYARAIRSMGGGPRETLRRLSQVDRLTPDAHDVVARVRGRYDPSSAETEALDTQATRELPAAAWAALVVLLVVGGTVTGVLAVRGLAGAVPTARWTVSAGSFVLGVLTAIATLVERPRPHWALRSAAAVISAGLLVAGVFLAVSAAGGTW